MLLCYSELDLLGGWGGRHWQSFGQYIPFIFDKPVSWLLMQWYPGPLLVAVAYLDLIHSLSVVIHKTSRRSGPSVFMESFRLGCLRSRNDSCAIALAGYAVLIRRDAVGLAFYALFRCMNVPGLLLAALGSMYFGSD